MRWIRHMFWLWMAGCCAQAQPDRVLISEFMAVNESGWRDEDRIRSDWIELYNSGTQAVNLGGWYLTDNRDNLTKWRFPLTPLAPGKFLIVFASDKNRAVAGRELHTNFRLSDQGEYLGLVMPDGLTVVSEYSPAYPPQWPDVAYGLGAIQSVEPLILATSPAKLLIPTPMTPPEWIRPDYDDSAWLPVPASVGFGDVVVATNIAALMQNVNSSAYLRIPFQVGPLTNASGDVIENNSLRLEYDDAVIAYLNGQEILRDNAPDGATWNSVALSKKSGTLSRDQLPLLPGDNWLTIHGLNWGAGSSDFRVNPSLTLTRRGKRFGFLIRPTPGDVNAQYLFTPGPIISEATSFPTWPKPADAIQVTARVIPWQDPIDQVTLLYFGSVQVTTPMFDDGQHGDGFPGDGIYGATIPPGTGMPLEVLRWQIQATDLGGGNSQEPELRLSYPRQNRYRGYLGTTLAPTRPPSRLRTLYLNVTTNAVPLMNSGVGAPCAVSFDGQFYDNAWISLRGSSHDQKNSHRIDFTPAHAFSRLVTEKSVTSFYLTSAFPDPSYLREYLCYWLLAAAGSPAPWHEPVVVWLNGSFYQLAFLSEEFGAAQIEHLGYDPTGDRFRETGTLRTNVNQGSLSALTAALAETLPLRTRRNALFDLVDIPQVINHLAVARFVQDNDDVVDNLSLYCDTHGDGRWRVIPFDMSTTWGLPDLSAFPVNDFGSGFPLYGSSVAPRVNGTKADFNRLYDALFLVAETRQMFLRRLRTLVETQATPRGSSRLERQIAAMKDLLSNDAALDHARWPWTTVDSSQAIDALLSGFLYPRVTHLLEHHCITNTALPLGITPGSNAGLPVAQPQDAAIALFDLQPTPASGVAAQEYLAFTNANDYAVDLSGWQIGGDIHFTFPPGTVLPAQRVLYVSPDTRAFRARSTAPRGGQGLFVIGNYDGQLSSRGGQITLTNAAGALITSGPYTHQPSPAQLNLRITEIHYHPRLPPLGPSPLEEDYAFLELMNVGLEPISLDGVRLTSGVSFAFTGSALTTLAPGQRVVIVKNLPAFRARYGSEPRVAGEFIGTLDNHGEKIRLEDRAGESILEFTYHPNWYKSTDGPGFSLVVTDELAPPEEWNNPALWRASAHPGGSPGRPDDPPVPIPAIWINEILAHTAPPYTDAVELYNPNAADVDIGGWYLTDNFAEPDNFKFPRATIVPARNYLAFDTTLFDSPFLPRAHRFSFGNDGDQVYLLSAGPDGEFTGFVDGFVFGATEPNQSLGRYRLSTGAEQLAPLQEMSFMLPNGPLRIGPVVITEAYYHPPEDANDDLLLENLDDEFIEVFNLSDQPVALGTNTITPQPWRLAKAIDYSFPAGFTLPSHSFAVVVRFDPQFQPVLAESFRNRFGMPAETPLLGPYLGRLSNQGERIELQKPAADSTNHVHYVTVDPVTYQPQLPWPARWVNGAGASLQRLDAGAYSDDPINWGEGPPTPGRSNSIVRYPVVLDTPTRHILAPGASLLLTVNAVRGDDPITVQWFRNGAAIPDATGRTLQLTNAAAPDTGDYDVVVSDPDGRVTNRIAIITVLAPPSVIVPPQDQQVAVGRAVRFSVDALGSPLLRYQWQFEYVNLPGATGAVLRLDRVNSSQAGPYRVIVSNRYGSATSEVASLRLTQDRTGPRLTVTVPAPNARTTSPYLLAQGTASDNSRLTALEYSHNDGPFLEITGAVAAAEWSIPLTLTAGTNTLEVRALDDSGNVTSVSRRFVRAALEPLLLVVQGPGTIDGVPGDRLFEVGRHYTLRAVPGLGANFAYWSGDFVSASPQLSFVMQPDLIVHAIFVTNRFYAAQGTYYGIMQVASSPDNALESGWGRFTLNDRGAYSALWQMPGSRFALSGMLDAKGNTTDSITLGPGIVRPVYFNVNLDETETMRGSLPLPGGRTGFLLAYRAQFYNPSNPSPYQARYTCNDLQGNRPAGGASFGTVVIDQSNLATLTAFLADGTRIIQRTPLSRQGWWPIYSEASRGGVFAGWLQTLASPTNTPALVSSNLLWVRLPNLRAARYPTGFADYVSLQGDRYEAPLTPLEPVLDFHTAEWIASGEDGATSIPVSLLPGNLMASDPPGTLSARFDVKQGLLSGTFVAPDGRPRRFQGAIDQPSQSASGYFLEKTASGWFDVHAKQ